MTKTIANIRPVALAALLLAGTQAYAVGTGTIADGVGSISTAGRNTTVNQSSDKLIINWDNMNVGSTETLAFRQPNANASVLNRINSVDPTSILGTLTSNGRVFIVNPNGVVFGSGARVNVGSLVASSLNITDDVFKNGWRAGDENILSFEGGGQGDVINNGRINATGSVMLLGSKKVENNGSINSDGGNIALASGGGIYVYVDGQRLSDSWKGPSADALVNNNGSLRTADGNVSMHAAVLDATTRSVINNTGTIEARSLTLQEGGRPEFGYVEFSSDDGLTGGAHRVEIGGVVDAAGTISAAGHNITVSGDVYAGNELGLSGNAATTDSASIQAGTLALYFGDFDLTRGSIATDHLFLSNVGSANVSLIGAYGDYDGTRVSAYGVEKDVRISSADGLFTANMDVGGNVELSSQKDIIFEGRWWDPEAASVQSGGSTTINAKNVYSQFQSPWSVSAISAGGDVAINAQEGADLWGGVTGQNINVRANGDVTTGHMAAKGDLGISGGGDVHIRGDLSAQGDMRIEGRNVWADTWSWWPVSADAVSYVTPSIYAGGNLAMNARKDISAPGTITVFGNTAMLNAETGRLQLGNFRAFGASTLRGAEGIVINESVFSGADLALESLGDVVLEKGAAVGGNLNYKLASTSQVFSGGPVQVRLETTGLPESGVQPLQ
ncbi:two-partner secretion domain-containing protein [Ralstonia sp. 24A2]|uniref:two-partner secretion domain-containing protein n=1 Tax=Ralstonia sp. 24A2 TaxID=3447364 RepID=UPI003F6A2C69